MMIQYDVDRARDAVQFLVDDPFIARNLRKIRALAKRPRSVPFKGDAEPLNELLVIGRQSLQAMENLLAVAEFKRGNRGDYQREFMAQQRARDRQIIRLEETLLGATLSLDERLALVRRERAKLMEARKVFVAEQLALYREKFREDPSTQARSEIVQAYWDRVDAELAAAIVHAEAAANVHRKDKPRLHIVERPDPKTVMAAAFKKVMRKKDDIERGR